ncbi:hypothetical protein [Citricoccus sp. GCM10030269]|uniref:hypothetical protein n=1 Tax=Citricoccus sp. GCM10030269 TaxID=3273388 RepID=UPI00361BE75D
MDTPTGQRMTDLAAASLNPLIPSSAEWVVMALSVAQLVLWTAALLWLLRRRDLDASQRIVGMVLATVLPIIGPLLVWWAIRRPRQQIDS